MEITRRSVGGVTILNLIGRLAVSSGETEIVPLRTAIRDLIAEGRVNVTLDLAGLAYIDARGLAELVLALVALRRHGGELMLVAPTGRVRRMLTITRLDTVFALYDSEPDAIGSTRRSEAAPRGLRGNHSCCP